MSVTFLPLPSSKALEPPACPSSCRRRWRREAPRHRSSPDHDQRWQVRGWQEDLTCLPTNSRCPIRCSTMCRWPAQTTSSLPFSTILLLVIFVYGVVKCHHCSAIKWSHMYVSCVLQKRGSVRKSDLIEEFGNISDNLRDWQSISLPRIGRSISNDVRLLLNRHHGDHRDYSHQDGDHQVYAHCPSRVSGSPWRPSKLCPSRVSWLP